MRPKRTEAELDALVELTRNEGQPACLTPEMLSEEDVVRMLRFARMTIQTRRNIEDIEATITYRGTPRGREHAKCVALCDDSLATIDRLLK